jgi:Tol biopolymer transport system component
MAEQERAGQVTDREGEAVDGHRARAYAVGSKIVFDSNRSGNFDIWIVHCSFQRPTFHRITNHSGIDYAPDWQSL